MQTYNLKKEYNWRGDIAELLVKHHYKARRTKGCDFRLDPNLPAKQNEFLLSIWGCIDLYGYDDRGSLKIYEVKSRTRGINRKYDITSMSLDAYRKARALKIKVSLIIVTFHDNWEVSFSEEDFDEKKFKVNEGGWYRRREKRVA